MTDLPPGLTPIDDTATAVPAGLTLVPDSAPAPGPASPLVDSFLAQTSVGRVLDAFGMGARDGWGARPVVLPPETEAALRRAKIFQDHEDATAQPLRFFNEAVLRPAAAGLDAVLRGGMALATGVAASVGQIADETGLSDAVGLPGSRLGRDVLMLGETLGITSASITPGPRRVRAPEQARVMENMQRVEAEAVTRAPAPDRMIPPPRETALPETPLVDRAGNINLDRIQAPDDVRDVIRAAAAQGDGFEAARRGVIGFDEMERLADAVGMTPDALAKRQVGQAFNAEEAVAARNLMVQSAEKVRDAALRAQGGSDADVLAFQEAMTRHMAIQEQVAGLTAEAGRALASFRVLAQGTREAKALGKMIEDMGGRDSIGDIARRVTAFNSPEQVSRFLMEARKASTSDQLIEAWINGLLSGPQTHVTNILSNTLVALWDVPETAVAAGISKLRGRAGLERTLPGEAAARLFGTAQGAMDGLRAGWAAYRSEIPTGGTSKLEVPRPKAIPSKTLTFGGRTFEVGGKQVRIPGRLLQAEDEFFKAIGYRQEINAQAYALAAHEGLDGQAFARRMAQLVENPTAAMIEAARANADYQTFTKALGRTGKTIQQFANSHPLAKLVVPFTRTPTNIFKYFGERTVLGRISGDIRATLRGEKGARAADEQAARIALGSAVSIATASLAAAGVVTGSGPRDPRARAVMFATGWQPNSIRVGDFYYSYGRLEPLGMLMGTAASAVEVAEQMTQAEADKVGALILSAVSKNLLDKTWTKGIASLIEAVQDPDRYSEGYVRRLVASAVPSVAAQAARAEDPVLREAGTIIEAVRARLPGLSKGLLPRRDIWGEPIELQGGAGPDIISPIYESRRRQDPVSWELVRLKLWPAAVPKQIRGVDLTPAEYDEFQMISGRLAKRILDQQVASPGFGALPEFARRDMITRTITTARAQARSLMMMRHEHILTDAVNARLKQIGGDLEQLPSAR